MSREPARCKGLLARSSSADFGAATPSEFARLEKRAALCLWCQYGICYLLIFSPAWLKF
jgi:hypothetical protein